MKLLETFGPAVTVGFFAGFDIIVLVIILGGPETAGFHDLSCYFQPLVFQQFYQLVSGFALFDKRTVLSITRTGTDQHVL